MTSALAKIHIGKKALGLDETTYRAMLKRLTGRESAKDLPPAQLSRVLEEMKAKGAFKAASNSAYKPLAGAYAKKLQALWIAGWNLGVIRDKSDKALLAFITRQTGLSHARFLHYPADATRAIEGLKAWVAREAGFSWGDSRQAEEAFAARIAYRQWQMLRAAGKRAFEEKGVTFLLTENFSADACAFCGKNPSRTAWIELMNTLGREVRKCAKKQQGGKYG